MKILLVLVMIVLMSGIAFGFECTTDDDCNHLDADYCNGDIVYHDYGYCNDNVCYVDTIEVQDCYFEDTYCVGNSAVSELWGDYGYCDNGVCEVGSGMMEECWVASFSGCYGDALQTFWSYCNDNGPEAYCAGEYTFVEDCSYANPDIPEVAECNYNPDGNPKTWDSYPGWTAGCDPYGDGGGCAPQPVNWQDDITHTCDITQCGAECEDDANCESYCVDDLYFYNGACETECTCSYQTENCDLYGDDGWYETGEPWWVDDTECTEKEQIDEIYVDYTCLSGIGCDYDITDMRMIDTGNVRNKTDGTLCSTGICSGGVCAGCITDDDCDYLNEFYCQDSNISAYDLGRCVNSQCTIDTITSDCNTYDVQSCNGDNLIGEDWGCVNIGCAIIDTPTTDCNIYDHQLCSGDMLLDEDWGCVADECSPIALYPIVDCNIYDFESCDGGTPIGENWACVTDSCSVVGTLPYVCPGITCGDTITEDTTLNNDLLNCPGDGLVIGANNVILDCDGHMITGSGAGKGIELLGHYATIKNCEISNFHDGVYLGGYDNNNINANVLSNSMYNIYMGYGSDNNLITNNLISYGGSAGIYMWGGSYNYIADNELMNNDQFAIYMYPAYDNEITKNNISGNNANGIYIGAPSDNNKIWENTIASNNRNGIYLSGSNTTLIWNNNIHNNGGGSYYNIRSDQSIEVSYNNGGNYWGKTTSPCFCEYNDPACATYDSNAEGVVDSYPYCSENEWTGAVTIKINISGKTNNSANAIVELKSATDCNVYNVVTNVIGEAVIDNVPYDLYDMTVDLPFYVRSGLNNTNVSNSGAYVDFGFIYPGDFNDDNKVDWLDLGYFSGAYNSEQGDSNYKDMCDLNGDDEVNFWDLPLLSTNYNREGVEELC